MLILEITAGVILGQFVYQYLVDDLIQGLLRRRQLLALVKMATEQRSTTGTVTDSLLSSKKQELH
jgi:hypothetical protein